MISGINSTCQRIEAHHIGVHQKGRTLSDFCHIHRLIIVEGFGIHNNSGIFAYFVV